MYILYLGEIQVENLATSIQGLCLMIICQFTKGITFRYTLYNITAGVFEGHTPLATKPDI